MSKVRVGTVTYLQGDGSDGRFEPVYLNDAYTVRFDVPAGVANEGYAAPEHLAEILALDGLVRYLFTEQQAFNMRDDVEPVTPQELYTGDYPNGFLMEVHSHDRSGVPFYEPARYDFIYPPIVEKE